MRTTCRTLNARARFVAVHDIKGAPWAAAALPLGAAAQAQACRSSRSSSRLPPALASAKCYRVSMPSRASSPGPSLLR